MDVLNERERTEICRDYGIDRQSLERFLEDHFVQRYEDLAPWPDDPVDLELEEIARQIGLPAYVLRRAQEEGAVSNPLTSGDLDALRCVRRLFGRSWFVRAQLVRSNKVERQSLICRPELLPWERWAYNRFLALKMERAEAADLGGTPPEDRLYLPSLLRTIDETFKIPASETTKSRLLQIRKMATNDFYAARQKGIDVGEMAKRRGIEPEREQ